MQTTHKHLCLNCSELTLGQLCRGSARLKNKSSEARTHARTQARPRSGISSSLCSLFGFVNTEPAVKGDELQALGTNLNQLEKNNCNNQWINDVWHRSVFPPLQLLHIHTRREFHALLHSLCFTIIARSMTDESACWNGTLKLQQNWKLTCTFHDDHLLRRAHSERCLLL